MRRKTEIKQGPALLPRGTSSPPDVSTERQVRPRLAVSAGLGLRCATPGENAVARALLFTESLVRTVGRSSSSQPLPTTMGAWENALGIVAAT